MRSPAWLGIAMTLTSVALLVAFEQAVRGGVRQGEMRRQAVAVRADAQWRCKALRGPRARDDCLAQLDSTSRGETPLPAAHLAVIGLPLR